MFGKFLRYLKGDSLVRDGFVLFLAMFSSQVLRFLYHVFMGRALGPSDYGVLSVLLSIIYFISVPIYVVQNSITKFVAEYNANKSLGSIASVLRSGLKLMFFAALILIFLFVMTIPFLSSFFAISAEYFYLLIIIIFFAMLLPVLRGVFQGMQFFGKLGANVLLEGVFVLGFSVMFVWKGFGLTGAVMAIVLSYTLPVFLALIPLRNYLSQKFKNHFSIKSLFFYILPMLFALSFLTLFYTIDLFLVKYFFSSVDAGYYAAISLIGKIVFFASSSVHLVMFPKLVDLHSKKKGDFVLLAKALLIISLISFCIISFYFIFGKFVVWTIFGNDYLWISSYIGWFGLAMGFFSLSYALALYNLSLNKSKFIYILPLLLIIEAFLIKLFHSSLMQIVMVFLTMMILLFLTMVIYSFANRRLR